MPRRSFRRSSRGFTLIEALVVVLMIGMVAVIAAPFIQGTLRHERLRSCAREIYSIVLAARMQAVKRNTNVIVQFDLANHRVVSWADTLPYDFVQGVTEPNLANYQVPDYIYFRFAPVGGAVDGADSVAFDTYNGNAGFKDMIVFQGDGTILTPGSAGSAPPLRPSSYTATVPYGSVNCKTGGGGARGVYISDNTTTGDVNDRNTFRISVDDFGRTGKGSLLKWLPSSEGGNGGEYDYVPPPWKWTQ